MDATKPCELISFGAMDVTKPYKIYTLWGHVCHQTLRHCYALGPWMSPNPMNLYKTMDVPKPCKFIGFGAMDVTKPYKIICFGATYVTKPRKHIGPWMAPKFIKLYALGPRVSPNRKNIRFGAMDVTKPYKFICFGAMDVTL